MKTTGIWGLFSMKLVCFPQHQKGFYVGKKRLPFPQRVWKGNLYAWWVKFPFCSYSLASYVKTAHSDGSKGQHAGL